MVGVVLFEYGHCWAGSEAVGDSSRVNLGTTVRWLDESGFDSYLIGGQGELLLLSGGCWVSDYETWAWSNVVAVSRQVRGDLVERWGGRVLGEGGGEGGGVDCYAAIDGQETGELLLAAPRSSDPLTWRQAAADFARLHGFRSAGGCEEDEECVVDLLLGLLYEACAEGEH